MKSFSVVRTTCVRSQLPHRRERDERRGDEEPGAGERQRPAEREARHAEHRQRERPRQRLDEDDAVAPRIEVDTFIRVREHRG